MSESNDELPSYMRPGDASKDRPGFGAIESRRQEIKRASEVAKDRVTDSAAVGGFPLPEGYRIASRLFEGAMRFQFIAPDGFRSEPYDTRDTAAKAARLDAQEGPGSRADDLKEASEIAPALEPEPPFDETEIDRRAAERTHDEPPMDLDSLSEDDTSTTGPAAEDPDDGLLSAPKTVDGQDAYRADLELTSKDGEKVTVPKLFPGTKLQFRPMIPIDPDGPRVVMIESPFVGDQPDARAYARRAMHDSIVREEAPFAAHLLYEQPGIFTEATPGGPEIANAFGARADAVIFYMDHGMSETMVQALLHYTALGKPVEFRYLDAKMTPEPMGKTPA